MPWAKSRSICYRSDLPQLADAPDFDPFDDIDIAGVIEARAVRADEFARREVVAGEFASLHVFAAGIVAELGR